MQVYRLVYQNACPVIVDRLKESDRPRVPCHYFVDSKQEEPFGTCLGNKHTVKWVLVNSRQMSNSHGMCAGNGDLVISVLNQATPEHL